MAFGKAGYIFGKQWENNGEKNRKMSLKPT